MAAPARPWVILGRIARVEQKHGTVEERGVFSVALDPPLGVSTLTLHTPANPERSGDDADEHLHPYTVGADDDTGLLLLHVSRTRDVGFDLERQPPGLLLVARGFLPTDAAARRDAPTSTAVAIDYPPADPRVGTANIRNVGLVSRPGSGDADFVVAQLRVTGANHATLLSIRSGAEAWAERAVFCPDMSGRRSVWSAHDVISHDGKLWWIDLVWGLLGCDPFAGDNLVLRHVRHPVPEPTADDDQHGMQPPQRIENRRMVRVSQGAVRFVDVGRTRVDEHPGQTAVTIWTLVLGAFGGEWWVLHRATSLAKIWGSERCVRTAMPPEVPGLALLHPGDPDVVFFFLDRYLFSVNVSESRVVEFVDAPRDMVQDFGRPPSSWRHVLAWVLPPSLANELDRVNELVSSFLVEEPGEDEEHHHN